MDGEVEGLVETPPRSSSVVTNQRRTPSPPPIPFQTARCSTSIIMATVPHGQHFSTLRNNVSHRMAPDRDREGAR